MNMRVLVLGAGFAGLELSTRLSEALSSGAAKAVATSLIARTRWCAM